MAGYRVVECKPRPYPEANQSRYSRVHRRGWPDNLVADLGSRMLQLSAAF